MRYEDFEIADGTYELKNGTQVIVWTQSDGQWACAARDHSPAFCRRCHNLSATMEGPVPHLDAALLANVLDGQMDLLDDPDRGWLVHVNEFGERRVEEIMARSGRGELA